MEKKQIVFIHGGNAYSKYEDFLSQLRTNPIDDPLNHIERKRWQPTVREAFLETCEVYYPQMPNSKNAKYVEWNIWFERYNEFLRDDVVLIGHSLGGMFLAKYLSENIMPVRIRALYFLAAPWKTEKVGGEDGGDFGFDPEKLPRLASQVSTIHILHSTDDPVVPYAHALEYKKTFPDAELVTYKDKGHFVLPEFKEFIEYLKHALER